MCSYPDSVINGMRHELRELFVRVEKLEEDVRQLKPQFTLENSGPGLPEGDWSVGNIPPYFEGVKEIVQDIKNAALGNLDDNGNPIDLRAEQKRKWIEQQEGIFGGDSYY